MVTEVVEWCDATFWWWWRRKQPGLISIPETWLSRLSDLDKVLCGTAITSQCTELPRPISLDI